MLDFAANTVLKVVVSAFLAGSLLPWDEAKERLNICCAGAVRRRASTASAAGRGREETAGDFSEATGVARRQDLSLRPDGAARKAWRGRRKRARDHLVEMKEVGSREEKDGAKTVDNPLTAL